MPRNYVLAIPSEADLTVPVLASAELTKLYIEIMTHVDQLHRQTREIRGQDENGRPTVVVMDHPDLKLWTKLAMDCLAKIGALTANVEQSKKENKLKAISIILESLPQEKREEYIRAQMQLEESKRVK
jgi:hypothetical protein